MDDKNIIRERYEQFVYANKETGMNLNFSLRRSYMGIAQAKWFRSQLLEAAQEVGVFIDLLEKTFTEPK